MRLSSRRAFVRARRPSRASRRLRTGMAASALAAGIVGVLSAGAAFAKDHPPGGSTPPRAGHGVFNGISAWGNGAPGCARHETSTVLEFHCSGIKENFIGSFVLIQFPSKNFKALVELREG